MKYLFIFFIVLLTSVSCGVKLEEYKGDGVMTPRYIEDKASISRSIVDTIEAYRISMMYEAGDSVPEDKEEFVGYKWNPYSSDLYFYARRKDEVIEDVVPSPMETQTQLNVFTDTIFYSADSLLCFALIVIENKFDDIPGLEYPQNGWDGFSLIGIRDSINQPFMIYPREHVRFCGFLSYRELVDNLRFFYFKEIVGDSKKTFDKRLIEYRYGANDPRFFETAPDFYRNEKGKYYFQVREEETK